MSSTLSSAEEAAWRPYIEASLRLETSLDDVLRRQAGLSLFDYHLLLLLSEVSGHRMRMAELADRMVFSRSRMTYQIKSMADRGLVLREPVPEDRRGYRAVLTASGLETFRKAAPIHAASVRALFLDNISGDELSCLGAVFARLRVRLEQLGVQ